MNNNEPQQMSENETGYRRPRRKRHARSAIASFLLALAALLLLLIAGVRLCAAFREAAIGGGELAFAKAAVLAAAIAAGIALLLAIVALFQRRKKKTLALSSLLLSLLLLLLTVAAMDVYHDSFSSMNEDQSFRELPDELLHVQTTEHDGELRRENKEVETTLGLEAIEESASMMEIEWEHLPELDMPEAARQKMYTGDPKGPSYLLDGSEQVTNFLLFGLDAVNRGATDSIILFSVDRAHHKIKMISIARDSYVRIPAWGTYGKLAYAHSAGGAQWAVATINSNYSLNVTDYISVNFEQFAQIVDYVGGVDVELDAAEVRYLCDYDVQLGMNHLDGATAVAYSRIRQSSAEDNEERRTGRQREVLTSIMNSMLELPLTAYPDFIRNCLGACTTSLNADELMLLAAEVVQNDYTIEQCALIGQVDYWGGIMGQEQYFYVVYDLNRASDKIYRLLYEDLYISGYTD